MKVIIQRSLNASVSIDKKIVGQIDKGYVLLTGFTEGDNPDIIDKMVNKIINLRIFSDEDDKLNLSIKDIGGSILSISQFTLYAKLNGRRPSFTKALNYIEANELYNLFNERLKKQDIVVETGEFGADMKVSLVNDGPVTIIIDSEEDF